MKSIFLEGIEQAIEKAYTALETLKQLDKEEEELNKAMISTLNNVVKGYIYE